MKHNPPDLTGCSGQKFPLKKGGAATAAWGLSFQSGKDLTLSLGSQTAASSSRHLTTSLDNPRAYGAAPFFKGEFVHIPSLPK